MERSSQRAVQLFRRTRDFLVRTAPTAAYGTIGAQVEVLGQAADRISAAAVEMGTRIRAARMGTQQIRQRTGALRLEFTRPVARIASQRFANDPAPRTALGMPRKVSQPEALGITSRAGRSLPAAPRVRRLPRSPWAARPLASP